MYLKLLQRYHKSYSVEIKVDDSMLAKLLKYINYFFLLLYPCFPGFNICTILLTDCVPQYNLGVGIILSSPQKGRALLFCC